MSRVGSQSLNPFDTAAFVQTWSDRSMNVCGGTCIWKFSIKIASLPGHTWRSIEPFCSTRCSPPGVRSKEEDEAFGPRTRVGRNAWPSVVIEVGYSETEPQLEMDANWWITKSGGQTKFVITKVNRNPFELKINC